MNEQIAYCQIGEAAERAGATPRTLRHYEELGLLTPLKAGGRGVRLYTEFDLRLIRDIQQLSTLGFSLEEIGRIMDLKRLVFAADGSRREAPETADLPLSDEELSALRERTAVIRETIREQAALLERLDEFLAHFGESEEMRARRGQS